MALQYSVNVRNAQLDAFESAIGVSALLHIRTGAPPANCAAADAGTLLASITLPADWMAAAAGGVKDKLGTWQDTSADATGTAGHFRIKDSTNTTCHAQGTVGMSGADMLVDNSSFAIGQSFTVSTFQLQAGNA
jgi:hypothetical protein